MKITNLDLEAVQVNHRGDWVFVRVNTDSGIHGIGELRAGKNYFGRLRAVKEMEIQLANRDPFHIGKIISEFSKEEADQDRICALSAIEQALWDIRGKALGKPIYTFFEGPYRNEIRLYANINRATIDRTPDGFAQNAIAAVKEGFDAVKLAPFDELPNGVDSGVEAEKGIACLQAVREAIGPKIDLLVDCHSRFTVNGALEVANILKDLDLFWFEQPVPESNIKKCLKVKNQCGLLVAGGENRMLVQRFQDVFEHKTMDVVMPDVTVVGGIGELKKVGNMADLFKVSTAPHGPFSPLSLAAGAHAMSSLSGFLILEYAWGEIPWRGDLTQPPEQIKNGRLILNHRPGLGFELNPETVDAHRKML